MANTKISDIANSVSLGINPTESVKASEASLKAGMGVYHYNETGVKAIEGSAALVSGFAGVLKEHYYSGLDATLTNGSDYELIKRGPCAVFIDDPGKTFGPGVEIWVSGATAGSFGLLTDRDFIALSGASAVGKTIDTINSGDTVAMVNLY